MGCLWSIVSLPPAFNLRCPFVKKISFLENPGNLSGPESCNVFVGFAFKMKVSIINFFENNTSETSVIEAILTSLWARNCAKIQQVLI